MENEEGLKRDSVQRSVFCTYSIPDDMQETEDYISVCQWFCEQWVGSSTKRQAMAAYCMSANGYKHVHTVFSQETNFRFSAVLKAVPAKGKVEATRGTKEQALAYIRKQGKFEEAGETILAEYHIGEIVSNQGARNDLDRIGCYINEGWTPQEIMNVSLSYRKYDKIIKDAYFAKRNAETPFLRDIVVEWHVGESGTGKTYYAKELIESEGEESVYFLSDYSHGGLDHYNGEPILFLDEFRGQIRYSTLLSMLQGYKQQFHARYTNIIGLWKWVIITSVMPPELVYQHMVQENRNVDTIKQLYRRINRIVYHYKSGNEFCIYVEDMDSYTNYEDMKQKAHGSNQTPEFLKLTIEEQKRLDELFG